ncbi:lipid-binding protein [Arachidicoccus soli]|uniref:Uncharacterized protein n=1 Tax=Arachidicoccus soli TaxID=2341117 RepID=A0A386HTH2_9BACT|nr:lipid-binding protein [Arachidicoccus soli]AYD49185.1 hypothetical protein D6B99_17080 [Arachidicoccus soli]
MKLNTIKKILFLIIGGFIFLSSCQKSVAPGDTSAVKVANDWWCRLLDNNGNELAPYAPFETYNTSANKDSIWVDDEGNLYNFKAKAKFSTDGTFETAGSSDAYYHGTSSAPATVIITNGKVMVNAAKSKTGITVDSIYMKVIFSDDPSTTYIIEGKAKTGFDADNY